MWSRLRFVQGWSTRVLDVAGERDNAEVLEREGQDLARAQQAQADVVLRLVPPEVDVHQAQAVAAENEIVIASTPIVALTKQPSQLVYAGRARNLSEKPRPRSCWKLWNWRLLSAAACH